MTVTELETLEGWNKLDREMTRGLTIGGLIGIHR
jgi:hypothetical protein